MTTIDNLILLPIITGLLLFLVPVRAKTLNGLLALFISLVTLYFSIVLYRSTGIYTRNDFLSNIGDYTNIAFQNTNLKALRADNLSKLIVLFIGFFSLLISIYSITFRDQKNKLPKYSPYILLTLGASNGAVLSNNLILFLIFWGFLGITLYKLIYSYDEESSAAANKSLILIGGSDALMMFGTAIIWKTQGTLNMSGLSIDTNNAPGIIAFLCLVTGSFTKAGAFPFHTWIPDYTKKAPAPSSAYLPASLDKLLGIYFLARILHELFIVNEWLTLIIIFLGASTIIIAVMMALIQKDYKRLLGYHAVSQVGYMVIGLGLGTLLGIIGGLFHMINHALYKSGLFLAAGCIKKQTDKDKLGDLGGISKVMPITFITALIFALSISGIPPFNGFASKWIIYQGIIEFGREAGIANKLWILWLALAVIGSALTLASFIKFISGIFLGRRKSELAKVKEANFIMLIPLIAIAILCTAFGVFATRYIVPFFFEDITGEFSYIGSWSSGLISALIIVSILLGFLIYAVGNIKNIRREDSFIGGETSQDNAHSVTEFYNTISSFKLFSKTYERAKLKWFDIYHLTKDFGLWINLWMKKAHNGILSNYASWLIAGLFIMLIIYFIN